MTGPGPSAADDDELLAALGAAVRAGDGVPAWVRAAGEAAFTWRTVDAELARLESDGDRELAGLRGAPAEQELRFATDGLAIELDVARDALRGQLVPAQAGRVRVRPEGGGAGAEVEVDELGWFVVTPAPPGTVRLHVRTADGASVLTEPFSVPG